MILASSCNVSWTTNVGHTWAGRQDPGGAGLSAFARVQAFGGNWMHVQQCRLDIWGIGSNPVSAFAVVNIYSTLIPYAFSISAPTSHLKWISVYKTSSVNQ